MPQTRQLAARDWGLMPPLPATKVFLYLSGCRYVGTYLGTKSSASGISEQITTPSPRTAARNYRSVPRGTLALRLMRSSSLEQRRQPPVNAAPTVQPTKRGR